MFPFEPISEAFGTFSVFSDRFHDFRPALAHVSTQLLPSLVQRTTEEVMSQVNTFDVAADKVIEVGRGTQANGERLWREGLCRLNQGRQRFFGAIVTLLKQITSDLQPNSAYYLGTYVPFMKSMQPPIHKND